MDPSLEAQIAALQAELARLAVSEAQARVHADALQIDLTRAREQLAGAAAATRNLRAQVVDRDAAIAALEARLADLSTPSPE